MQLEASKRHASARPARPLHKRLARRRAAQERLFAGGVAALAGSALAWLFGLTLPLHLALLGLGFVGGFFWRFAGVGRRAERWAFGWIEPQAGLSYQTALELPASDTSALEAALGEAVRERAARAERLGTPPLEPWALPPLVLALALAAVPHFVLPTLRAPLEPLLPPILTTANPDIVPPAKPEAGAPEPEAAAAPETGTPETAEPEPGTDTPSEENAANDGGDSSVNTDAAPATGAAPSESETLEQFLEGSGAAQPGEGGREASGEEAQAAAEAAAKRSEAQDEGTPGGEGNGPGQPSAEARPGGSEDAPANAGAGEPAADDALESTNRDLGGARPSGQQDEASGQEGSEAGGEGTPPDAQAAPPQGAQQGAGEQGQGDGPSQPGEAADGRSQTGQGREQGNSDEAGRGSGGETPGGGERLPGGASGDLERLTGERAKGDPNLRAETLQQGEVPGALPRTGGPDAYRRAAEEVIREGRIPLEYQQIVRDYFR